MTSGDSLDASGWRTDAFKDFESNLAYARNLVAGGQHLENLRVGAFDVADLYRAAWVQAVSALDHWIHRELYERALAFALNSDAPRPKKFLTLQIPMSLFENVHHQSATLEGEFVAYLESHFGYQSFQSPDKIKQALSIVSDAPLWAGVERRLAEGSDPSSTSAVGALRSIVQRRNRIAHEADRDPNRRGNRYPISEWETKLAIDHIYYVAEAIAQELGAPPPVKKPIAPKGRAGKHNGRGFDDLSAGGRVVHEKYGEGLVVDRSGAGVRATATVDFGDAGTIRLMLIASIPMTKRQ
ncbi:hypothetical protein [Actinokineospora cianjurensis]|uniref:RiboL-PSP-HEPN domain-containing protein n=1 Tax=Actinokineospora cianjurensis TaxID=585224 RepID=A0A421B9F1_9PSEU|nr:hypothetical protein [Actinokineospora cianjurensis]RLK61162.1 hypothetical protein CLV68_1678 [Actinokineospora cianjurensis]